MTIFLKTDACGPRSGDELTEVVTMLLVPLENTTAVMPDSLSRAFSAGETSGNVERESYALMSDAMDSLFKETFESAKAWLKELRVMDEKGSYWPSNSSIPCTKAMQPRPHTHAIQSPCIF